MFFSWPMKYFQKKKKKKKEGGQEVTSVMNQRKTLEIT